MSGKPRFISTFCGTGGSSLGYKWAGFEEILAIDFDPHAVRCFKLNFPEVPVWQRSVIDVTAKEILDFTGLKCGELDLFDGSPPCQGFSTAGKRVVSDPRNDLFNHYARLVNDLQPKVFVMENVSGMIKGSMKGKFIEIMNVLKTMNYNVKCKLMNAMYYGVPQSRERTIFIGVRKDLGKQPTFPIPSNKIIPFRQACFDLRGNRPDDRLVGDVVKRMATIQPKNSWSTDLAKWTKVKGNSACGISLKWASWDAVVGTLPKSEISLTGIVHPDRERYLSIGEAKRVCSFPDDWIFPNRKIGMERLGNAVMPKFMQAIAETIKKEILD
jgi:DNA (cytosine-5)-methyltransferase 1